MENDNNDNYISFIVTLCIASLLICNENILDSDPKWHHRNEWSYVIVILIFLHFANECNGADNLQKIFVLI